MLEVLNLALPYFGLILLGYFFGRVKEIPERGLAWMNFFIVYVALPCLFYRIVAKTPLEELARISFVVGDHALDRDRLRHCVCDRLARPAHQA